MRIDSETKVEEIGAFLRSHGFSLNIEFGSGGYEVSIIDSSTKESFVEYSHDLVEAIKNVFKKASMVKVFKSKSLKEELTVPATPRSKLSISDLSKALSDGREKKFKL